MYKFIGYTIIGALVFIAVLGFFPVTMSIVALYVIGKIVQLCIEGDL